MVNILYIGGYSRSGSTILDILLSQDSQVFGGGELCYLFDDWLDGSRKCSCGKIYSECEFWSGLDVVIPIAEANAIIKNVESRKNFERVCLNKISGDQLGEYTEIQKRFFGFIKNKSNAEWIIDSSKSSKDMAGRAMALNKFCELDVRFLHLTKDGKSTTQSYVEKGRNWAMEGHANNDLLQGMRSIIGWTLANKIALNTSGYLGDKSMRLKYEAFCSDPIEHLSELENRIGITTELSRTLIESEAKLRPGHQVGGNRLRLQDDIRFKVGKPRPPKLDWLHRTVFSAIAGDLSSRMGY